MSRNPFALKNLNKIDIKILAFEIPSKENLI